VNGSGLTETLESAAPAELGQLGATSGLSAFEWLSASISAEDDGLRLRGATQSESTAELEPFESSLVDELPAGALAFVGFGNLQGPIDEALNVLGEQNPSFDQQLAQVELALGLSLRDDFLPLFSGEGALAVYPEAPIPAISLVLRVDDEQNALRVLDRLLERASAFAGEQVPAAQATTIDGIEAKELGFDQLSVYYAAFDGKLVVTTSTTGISSLREGGDKLADDADFTAARDAADTPDETTGFAYLNIAAIADLVGRYAALADDPIPPEVDENLSHLGGAFVWGSQDGGRASFSGFLGVE
jgi:hypothetical protein